MEAIRPDQVPPGREPGVEVEQPTSLLGDVLCERTGLEVAVLVDHLLVEALDPEVLPAQHEDHLDGAEVAEPREMLVRRSVARG